MSERLQWSSQESKDRGLKADEILVVTSGEYSDYFINRVFIVARDISSEELISVANSLPIKENGRPDIRWEYLYNGDLISALIKNGALKEIKAVEMKTEPIFRFQGGPGLKLTIGELE